MMMIEEVSQTLPMTAQPTDDALYLYMRLQQMEKDMSELRKRNTQLEEAVKSKSDDDQVSGTSPKKSTYLNGLQQKIAPAQSTSETSSDLIKENQALSDKVRKQAEKIEELERSVAFYAKRLEQSEELLYELQWDPSQDLAQYKEKNDSQSVEELQEKKIFQLLEQMRIMERGLEKKQQTIETLNSEITLLKRIGSTPTSPALFGSPGLQHVLIHSQSPAPSPSLTSTSVPPVPTSGWFSYFTGKGSDKGKIVQI